jgi:transitional endoplasmic reticulum ATPase
VNELELSVEVQSEFLSDRGKGIARLDAESMKRLDLSSGDIIEIQGQRKTYSKCLASPKENHAHGILNIDGLIRSNAGIKIGNRIYIKKILATRAKKITIAPLEITTFIEKSEIKEALTLIPIIQGDNIVFENLDEPVFFRILETIPSNSALITTSKTDVQIKEYYFLEKDKKLENASENLKQSYANDEFTEEEFLQIKIDFES